MHFSEIRYKTVMYYFSDRGCVRTVVTLCVYALHWRCADHGPVVRLEVLAVAGFSSNKPTTNISF